MSSSVAQPLPPKKFTKKNGVNVLNPDYLQWKKKYGKTVSPCTQSSSTWEAPVDKMIVQIGIIQGHGLAAKDRNLFGKKTTSDPYVLVYLLSSPPSIPGQKKSKEHKIKLGKTTTVKKNLSPTWNYSITMSIPYSKKNDSNKLSFQIYDEDKLSDDDCLGIVTHSVLWKDSAGEATWIEIPKESAKGASGKIQIKVNTSLHRVEGLKPYC